MSKGNIPKQLGLPFLFAMHINKTYVIFFFFSRLGTFSDLRDDLVLQVASLVELKPLSRTVVVMPQNHLLSLLKQSN